MILYEHTSAQAFVLKERSDEGAVSAPVPYCIPDQLTNWQMGQVSGILGDVLMSCGETANTILAGAQSIFSDTTIPEGMTAGEAMAQKVQLFLADLIENPLKYNLVKGIADLLKYAYANNTFAKLTAILFLKLGETSIGTNEFAARVALMESVPPSQLKGIKSFFEKKTTSLKNSKLPSTTSETKKKKNTAPTT